MAAHQHVELLRRIPIFRNLQDADLRRILDSPANGVVNFKPLQTIIEENEVGDSMYVLIDGLVDVRIKAVDGREITIATLQQGDYFGEQALLPGATGRRNATVRALQPTRALRITRNDVLLGVNKKEPEAFPELGGVEGMEETADQRIKMLLRGNRLFRCLNEADFNKVSVWTVLGDYRPGEIILREGDAGDALYVVMDGIVDVFVLDDEGKVVILAHLTRGHYFGEQALLPGSKGVHNANARANDAVKLVRIAREYFQLVLNRDKKLAQALKIVGDSQRKKIEETRRREDW
jgi:ATP-binding cassette subfamily B protein